MAKKLGRSHWQDQVCDDLKPILRLLEGEYGIRVESVRLVDRKSARTEIRVRPALAPEIVEAIRTHIPENPNLRFGTDWIECDVHYSFIASKLSVSRTRPTGKIGESVFLVVSSLALVLLGIWMVVESWPRSDWRDVLLGLVSIIFFGLCAAVLIWELVDHTRRGR